MIIAPLLAAIERRPADAAVERAVALQIADALACLALTRPIEEAKCLARFYGGGSPQSPHHRAAAAAAIIRMSEGDAIHVPSCLTPGAIVVPAALSSARDGTSLAAAVQAATAVGLWVAEGVGGVAALERGVWPTLVAAPAMAAAAAAVARGLDGEGITHAVALATAGSSGRAGRPAGTPSGRWLAVGEAVLRGLRAADAAEAGFRGDTSLPGPAWLAAQGGTEAATRTPDPLALLKVGLKPLMAARQGMNALAAFETIRFSFRPREIERIEVELPQECLPVVTRPLNEEDRLSRLANLPFRLATIACDRGALNDPSGMPADLEAARGIASRVRVSAGPFVPVRRSWPARLRVVASGQSFESLCERCPGDAGDQETQAEVVAGKIGRLQPRVGEKLTAVVAAQDGTAMLAAARQVLVEALEPIDTSAVADPRIGIPCPAG